MSEVVPKSEQKPRTAVVTGASSGLGVAIAKALGELGWNVAVGGGSWRYFK